MKYLVILLTTFILTACSSTSKYPHYSVTDAAQTLTKNKNGLRSTLNFKVASVAHLPTHKKWYLNALENYKKPENISIVISSSLASKLNNHLNIESLNELTHKNIEVSGIVKRTKIYFHEKGLNTGKFYYQNHLNLSDIEHISLVD